jgi:hypothetical protein
MQPFSLWRGDQECILYVADLWSRLYVRSGGNGSYANSSCGRVTGNPEVTD